MLIVTISSVGPVRLEMLPSETLRDPRGPIPCTAANPGNDVAATEAAPRRHRNPLRESPELNILLMQGLLKSSVREIETPVRQKIEDTLPSAKAQALTETFLRMVRGWNSNLQSNKYQFTSDRNTVLGENA
jgi:hypothetical protein